MSLKSSLFILPFLALGTGLSSCDSSTAATGESDSSGSTSKASSGSTTVSSLTLPGTTIDTASLSGTTKNSGKSAVLTANAMSTASSAFQTIFKGNANSTSSNALGSQTSQVESAQRRMAEAFADDPNNSSASFGLAATSLALRIQKLTSTFQSMKDSGYSIGGTSQPLVGSISSIETSTSSLARAMATPAKAPELHALQDTLENQLFPTMDSAIFLMQKAWSDSKFSVKIYDQGENDSLTIDRSDLGYALAITKAVRASLSWIIAYDFDITDANGSYAWIDTISHIVANDSLQPTTSAQQNALSTLKSLLAPTSSYLQVRSGKTTLLASVVGQFQEAIALAQASTNLASQLKANQSHLLIPQMTSTQKSDILRTLDSASLWLAGPRTVTLTWNKCSETSVYGTSSYTYTSYKSLVMGYGNPCPASYSLTSSSTNSTRFSLPALLSLQNLKVFLPSNYTWNDAGNWNSEGPILFTNGSKTISLQALDDLLSSSDSYLPLKTWIQWSDPTFGGVFPDLQQGGVFDLIFAGSQADPTTIKSAARLTTALRLLP